MAATCNAASRSRQGQTPGQSIRVFMNLFGEYRGISMLIIKRIPQWEPIFYLRDVKCCLVIFIVLLWKTLNISIYNVRKLLFFKWPKSNFWWNIHSLPPPAQYSLTNYSDWCICSRDSNGYKIEKCVSKWSIYLKITRVITEFFNFFAHGTSCTRQMKCHVDQKLP